MALFTIDSQNVGAEHNEPDSFFTMCSPTLASCGGVSDSSSPSLPSTAIEDSLPPPLGLDAEPTYTSDDQHSGIEHFPSALDSEALGPRATMQQIDVLVMHSAGNGGATAAPLSSDNHDEDIGTPAAVPPSCDPESVSQHVVADDTDQLDTLPDTRPATVVDSAQPSRAALFAPELDSPHDIATHSVSANGGNVTQDDQGELAKTSPDPSQNRFTVETEVVSAPMEVPDCNANSTHGTTYSRAVSAEENGVGGVTGDLNERNTAVEPVGLGADEEKAVIPLDSGAEAQGASTSIPPPYTSLRNGAEESLAQPTVVDMVTTVADQATPLEPARAHKKDTGVVECVDLTHNDNEKSPRTLGEAKGARTVSRSPGPSHGKSTDNPKGGPVPLVGVGGDAAEFDRAIGRDVNGSTANRSKKHNSAIVIDLTSDDSDDGDDETQRCPSCGARKRRSQDMLDGSEDMLDDRRKKSTRRSPRKMAKGIRINKRNPYLVKKSNHPVSQFL